MEQKTLNIEQNIRDSFHSIFTQTNVIYFFTFLAIYLCMSFLLRSKSSDTNSTLVFSRFIDALLLILFVIWMALTYFQLDNKNREDVVTWSINETDRFFDSSTSIFTLLIIIVMFYIFVYVFRVPMTADTKPASIDMIELHLWITFLIVLFFDFFKYVLGINLSKIIFNNILYLWNQIPLKSHQVDASSNIVSHHDPPTKSHDSSSHTDSSGNHHNDSSNNLIVLPSKPKPEVFHISNNLYTFDDAQAVCKAFDSRLATYDEVEDSYNNGGEWCSYGWSENQMALFPTQKTTWNELQKTKSHKNDCGRPGINGGYMGNSNIKFGVNCFGIKPAPTQDDLNKIATKKDTIYPKSKSDIALDAKVKYWKDNADKLLVLNPFNTSKWSEY